MKRKYLLIVFLIIVYISLFIYFGFLKDKNTVYLGDKTKVIINNNKLKVVNNNSPFFIKPAKVYYNGEFIDGYLKSKKLEDKDYNVISFLTKDKKRIIYMDLPIAYTGKVNLKIGNSEKNNILTKSEKEKLLSIAKENKIDGNITSSYRVDFDIDADDKIENIYSYTITKDLKMFTITIIVDNDNYEIIDIISNKDYRRPNIKRSSFSKFIDFNNDKSYEIVLYQSNGDDALGEYKIYKYQNGTIVNIK